MGFFADLDILDRIEAKQVADAIRMEAEEQAHKYQLPVEEYVGWKDAADWIEGINQP